jgi:Holliday junction resolvase
MSHYRLGAAFEHRVADKLRAAGWTVIRAAGSHGKADLVAVKPGRVVFVQCKRRGTLGTREWNELVELSQVAGAVPVMAQMPGRRGVAFHRLLGPKVKRGVRPLEVWSHE